MTAPEILHKTVCKRLLVDHLAIQPQGVYVDGTVGMGGHSLSIASRLQAGGTFIGLDRDPYSLQVTRERLKDVACRVILVQANSADLAEILKDLGYDKIDGCAFDWGISSWQLDHSGRGFSYQRSEPLDMRMNPSQTLTASIIVNDWAEEDLVGILKEYGEEYRWARRIAQKIVKARPIATAEELAEIISQSVPYRPAGHPARRTFQALRIAVNKELNSIDKALHAAIEHLNPNGRLASLAFHSLEDRMAKRIFVEAARSCLCPSHFPVCVCQHQPTVRIVTPKPLRASEEEVEDNPRARSALLRVVCRI